MTKHIDLGAETVAFVRMRMMEVIGEDPENLKRVELNMKEVKEQIFRLFYDYQVIHGWPHRLSPRIGRQISSRLRNQGIG